MRKGELSAIIDLNEDDAALAPLTTGRPIGTLPFAGRYRLIDFPLSAISAADIHSVAIFMPRSARSVQDHLRSGATWNLDLIQGGVFMFPYVATRDYNDASLRARYYEDYMQFLRMSGSRYTVILGAKNIANIDLNAVLDYHRAGDSPITAIYKTLPVTELGAQELTLSLSELGTASSVLPLSARHLGDAAKVAAFMDGYLIDTPMLIELLDAASNGASFRRMPELLRDAVLANNANAFEYTGFLARVTGIQQYFAANLAMLDDASYQALLYSSIPILTKSKNEIPTFFARDSHVVNTILGTGAYIEGSITHSVISRNVLVHRDAEVVDSVIMQGTKLSIGASVRNAILDKGVVIGPNVTVAGTPEHPVVVPKNATVYQSIEEVPA
ncbi:glucose-1-phosphate adenylyltransferase subunit GlgD [Lacticaseibacillus nasuensis]|uniref:ADP-glucose pyrophosphorylase n=1 Tax=Lacticaseibacillus nasuensis JCM 17158 TaxID=1291734 RepID=A0A0R1JHX3_9LACO|nr:glucose-1-phosphate adenylyltransferase subunit GlgD [Lacticaseibacillus nasuensis]KRK70877.1 ADP-glucose pyrophosphorylase [Lacticaseibacillus nasuensis JCM 17158]